MLRSAYLMLYTVEAKVYMCKVPVARHVVERHAYNLCKWGCRVVEFLGCKCGKMGMEGDADANHVRASSDTLETVVVS